MYYNNNLTKFSMEEPKHPTTTRLWESETSIRTFKFSFGYLRKTLVFKAFS